eukprot:COSAG01_NODE_1722_length_9386_cov_6.717562_11_plen_130_part_00
MNAFNTHLNTQSSRLMFINSEDADRSHQTHTTHFAITFKEALHVKRNEVMLVSLHSASVPYSFYNIRTGVNDKLKYKLEFYPYAQEKEVLFDAGNYNVNSLRNKVKTDIQTAIDAFISTHSTANLVAHT